MSVIVGHSVAGYATTEAVGPPLFDRWWKAALAAALVANLPDMDLVIGLVAGNPEGWHHGASHSLLAAVFAGIVAGVVFRGSVSRRRAGTRGFRGEARSLQRRRFWTGLLFVAPIYASHVLLDAVAPEQGKPDVGVPLLWPFSHAIISVPVPMPDWLIGALSLSEADVSGGYVQMLLAPHTMVVFLTEALLFAPLFLFALWLRHRRRGSLR